METIIIEGVTYELPEEKKNVLDAWKKKDWKKIPSGQAVHLKRAGKAGVYDRIPLIEALKAYC